MSDETLLTAQQVADMLAISLQSVLRRVDAGELPHIRLGKRLVRFRRSDVEAYLVLHYRGPGVAA